MLAPREPPMNIHVKRLYEDAERSDGYRALAE